MAIIRCNLFTFSQKDALLSIFREYSNEFEYTANGIFRRTVPPSVQSVETMGITMDTTHTTKRDMQKQGSVLSVKNRMKKIEISGLNLKRSSFPRWRCYINGLEIIMYHIYEGSADLMEIIFPRGKNTICNAFNRSVEKQKSLNLTYCIFVLSLYLVHPSYTDSKGSCYHT